MLVIDRIGTNMLGAYGSTWFETRNFNRLAARSLVFDQAISPSTDLHESYQRLWKTDQAADLLEQLGKHGAGSTLLTDDPSIADSELSKSFDRVVPAAVEPSESAANSIDETELAHFFAQATLAISEMEPGNCLWLHSRGLSGSWDAPLDLRERLADSEDPEPPHYHLPPDKNFDADVDDPDDLLGYQQVCAAQVTMIDDFFGVILDLLDSEPEPSTLFCFVSTRGFPMGEHGLVGESNEGKISTCHSECVHVPVMLCLPETSDFQTTRSVRIQNLVQPELVANWILSWYGNPSATRDKIKDITYSMPNATTEFAFSSGSNSESIQTHAWKLIRSKSDEGEIKTELYVKPDDRWEVNDVSRRCPQIVELLSKLLDQRDPTDNSHLPPNFSLPDELAFRLD